MDAAQWHQEIGLVTSSSAAATAGAVAASSAACATAARPPATERRARPQKEQALNCPRCNSTNTKFCYYNNYSLTQPRYFCKTCRRYWTEGGSLRNVPVGGGSRKNKRSSLSTTIAAATATAAASSITATSSLTAKKLHGGGDLLAPPKFHDGQDLNLGFPQPTGLPEFSESSTTALSAMELLRSTARGIGPPPPFLPLQLSEYPSGFGMQEFRAAPTLNFTMEGLGGGSGGGVAPSTATGYGPLQGVQESSRMLFPFEEAKPLVHDATSTAASEFDQGGGGGHGRPQQGGDPPGFWSGMLGGSGGGGGSW